MNAWSNPGVRAGLLAAVLFGAGTPLAKLLLDDVGPWLLAGLLYCGSAVGLMAYQLIRRAPRVTLPREGRLPLAGAILSGGVIAPVLLLAGLANMPASGASLLLNLEGVFTALLAWSVFKEFVDRRVAAGFVLIMAGAVALSVSTRAELGSVWPALAVLAACLGWALDNNLTRKVALTDATWLAAVKGGVAGPVNLAVGLAAGSALPSAERVGAAMLIGLFAYGVSLTLFIVAMRHLGTARAGAYFSVAPFFGGILAVVLGDHISVALILAGMLMGAGVWLHVIERHEHVHHHQPLTHTHWHIHDEHHDHDHDHGDEVPAAGHEHEHHHEPLTHAHPHYPDSHHRHVH